MNTDLETSRRFAAQRERRDFLGLAAAWSAVGAVGVALIGSLRLPMPSVFPESQSRVKLGPLGEFLAAELTHLPQQRAWIMKDSGGLYAISAVCTHLGCIVHREDEGFKCPCHGSVFDAEGRPVSGPAPKPLNYLDLSVSPDGQLVVDLQKNVSADARLQSDVSATDNASV